MAIGRSRSSITGSKKFLKRRRRRQENQRKPLLETLEARQLLAVGPQLIGIQPNNSDLLRPGAIRDIAPDQLVFRFDDNQVLDNSTLDGIVITRAGDDGRLGTSDDVPVSPGFKDLGDTRSEIVARFAEPLPDDLYRIDVLGAGPNALRNVQDERFNGGEDFQLDFELDLAPYIVAVVPQGTERDANGEIQQRRSQIDVYFNDDNLDVASATNPAFYQLIFTNDTVTNTDDTKFLPTSIDYDPGLDKVVLEFGQDLADLAGGGTFRLRIGTDEATPPVPIDVDVPADIVPDTVPGTPGTMFETALSLGSDILVMGDGSAINDGATLTVTNDQGVTTKFELNKVGGLDDPSATEVSFANGDSAATIATAIAAAIDGQVGINVAARAQNARVTLVGAADVQLSVGVTGLQLDLLQSLVVNSSIDPQPFGLEFPGHFSEPGHRHVPPEDHVNQSPDSEDGVTTIRYNFPDVYGVDPSGNLLFNVITERQKDLARGIFEAYSNVAGLQFIETKAVGGLETFQVVTGDLRAVDPSTTTGEGGTLGIAGSGLGTFFRPTAIMDNAEQWSDRFGGNWFEVAMHEIGHLLGLGHSSELPNLTVQAGSGGGEPSLTFGATVEPDFPGDHDIVHTQLLYRPESKDIDLYKFRLEEEGQFTAETMAERLSDASLLDTHLRLFKVSTDSNGAPLLDSNGNPVIVELARNDDYYSEDSFIELDLGPGTYYIGVTASGNDEYDPTIPDSGLDGKSQGDYQLRLNFRPEVTKSIVDADNPHLGKTPFDGDLDGAPGGVANFWFRTQPNQDPDGPKPATPRTIFVDKSDLSRNPAKTLGSRLNPFRNIDDAMTDAREGDIVRIVGNPGRDGDISTLSDNLPYEIGIDSQGESLPDGETMKIPRNVTVMIDGDAIFKMRRSYTVAGSTTLAVDRTSAALQVLGTPYQSVYFTSFHDAEVGRDNDPFNTIPKAGDWGGLIFKEDLDHSENRFRWAEEGIFMNYVNHADMRFGGGDVLVDGELQIVTPIHMVRSRPTVSFNTIRESKDAAMSADPDSFEETNFHTPRYQQSDAFTSDYTRIGPDIDRNTLTDNSKNALFVRVLTPAGEDLIPQTVAGRWDDTDIVHALSENLKIQGRPGGPIQDISSPPVRLVKVQPEAVGGATPLPAGIYNYRITFVDASGNEGPPSGTTRSATISGSNDAIQLTQLPRATAPFVSRRIYRSSPGPAQPYVLVREINATDTTFLDDGTTQGGGLDTSVTDLLRARLDARLAVDPGIIVKSEGGRFEVEMGAQMIAEGLDGREVIFTSLADDRYGGSGTFDSNDDGAGSAPAPGDWGGIYISHSASLSMDHARVTFAGGINAIEGTFAGFNALEVHQGEARVTNSVFQSNRDGSGGQAPSHRFGRGFNRPGTIFVRSAQPIIVNNIFRDNESSIININANALNKDLVTDTGRSRGFVDRVDLFDDNQGPLVRLNRLNNNSINGLEVRGETLTTQGVWDDTDVVHVLRDTIFVPDFHTFGGLRLESNPTESLVVKLAGTDAGFTATGRPLDIDDRIGGMLHIVGQPGSPVVFTSFRDDTIGAGFDARTGQLVLDTNNDADASQPQPGDWRSIRIDQYAHDRNLRVVTEQESRNEDVPGRNAVPATAQPLGQLASFEKDGDDVKRLGFEVQGFLSTPNDIDVYSFTAAAGSEVWFDVDRTTTALDSVVELIDVDGKIVAQSDNSRDEADGLYPVFRSKPTVDANVLQKDPFEPNDRWNTNPRDPGFRVVLPGEAGTQTTYYVRMRSSNLKPGDPRSKLQDPNEVSSGLTRGAYQLQVRLREIDEFAGSGVQFADIRFAQNGVEVLGQPSHSQLTGEVLEHRTGNEFCDAGGPQDVGNLLNTDRATLSIAGDLATGTDLDFFEFTVDFDSVQDGGSSLPVVFDLDYADGIGRPDTQLAIFRKNPVTTTCTLIFHGTDSNIADDQPQPLKGSNVDDLSRGTVGLKDPFIGPVTLSPGSYVAAVFSNRRLPEQLDQFSAAQPDNPLLRLRPINSITRIADDQIGAAGGGVDDSPRFELFPDVPNVLDLGTPLPLYQADLDNGTVPFHLGDVVLFVSQDTGTIFTGSDRGPTDIRTVDPFTGIEETFVGQIGAGIGDLVLHQDGTLRSLTHMFSGQDTQRDALAGNYLTIDPGNGNILATSDDGIQTFNRSPGGDERSHPIPSGRVGWGIFFDAMEFAPGFGGSERLFAVGRRGNTDPLASPGVSRFNNILYQIDRDTGAGFSSPGSDRQSPGRFLGAGTQVVERGQLETINGRLTLVEATEVLGNAPGLTTNPLILDGHTFTIFHGDDPDPAELPSTTFEFDSGPDAFIDIDQPRGKTVRDGDFFSLDGTLYQFDTGSVLVIDDDGSTIADGRTFSINDGAATVTFEFDQVGLNNGVDPNNVPISINTTDSRAQVAFRATNAINSVPSLNVNARRLQTTTEQRISLTGATQVTLSPGPLVDLTTPGVNGSISNLSQFGPLGGQTLQVPDGDVLTLQAPAEVLTLLTPEQVLSLEVPSGVDPVPDDDTFEITDDMGNTVLFEFDSDGNPSGTADVVISINSGDDQDAVVDAIVTAINNDPNAAILNLNAIDEGGGVIRLGDSQGYTSDTSNTSVQDGQLAGAADGETFTITDDVGNTVLFEFDSDGNPSGTADVVISINPGDDQDAVANAIVTAINNDPDADALNLNATYEGGGVIRLGGSQGYTSDTANTEVDQQSQAAPADGDTFTITDGVGNTVLFEFDSDGNLSGTADVVIQLNPGDDQDAVADAIATAINTDPAAALLGINATNEGDGVVHLGGTQTGYTIDITDPSDVDQGTALHGIADTESFIIDDGELSFTFEFDNDASQSFPGSIVISFGPSDSVDDIAVAIANAIESTATPPSPPPFELGLRATNPSPVDGKVLLSTGIELEGESGEAPILQQTGSPRAGQTFELVVSGSTVQFEFTTSPTAALDPDTDVPILFGPLFTPEQNAEAIVKAINEGSEAVARRVGDRILVNGPEILFVNGNAPLVQLLIEDQIPVAETDFGPTIGQKIKNVVETPANPDILVGVDGERINFVGVPEPLDPNSVIPPNVLTDKLVGAGPVDGDFRGTPALIHAGLGFVHDVFPNDAFASPQDLDGEGWSLNPEPSIGSPSPTSVPHVSIDGTGNGTFDYYSFTATAGSEGTFQIDSAFDVNTIAGGGATPLDTSLFLFDDAGNLLASEVFTGDPSLTHTFGSDGTFVIAVGQNGTFHAGGGVLDGPDGATIDAGEFYTLHVSLEGHPFPLGSATGNTAQGGVAPGNVPIEFLAEFTQFEMAEHVAGIINRTLFPSVDATFSAGSADLEISTNDRFLEIICDSPLDCAVTGAGGDITGLSYIDSTEELFAVSDGGGLYRIVGRTSRDAQAVFITTVTDDDGTPVEFQGLEAGPLHVEGGAFADLLFGISTDGELFAFNTSGELQNIFADAQSSVSTGLEAVNGLAFSNLDYSLWHPTRDTAGAGGAPGGGSYYFGYEAPLANGIPINTRTNPVNSFDFNFPGGAHGTLETEQFSLKGASPRDLPVLYFTYFLETEAQAARDAFRVFVTDLSGDWQLLNTNTFDDTATGVGTWRQVRVPLDNFAGEENLRLRFEFHTAGASRPRSATGTVDPVGEELRALPGHMLRDGQAFTLDDGDFVFEFDLGYTLVTPTGAHLLDGETFTVDGTTYEFNKSGGVAGSNTPVAVDDEMTALDVARMLEGLLGGIRNGNRLNLPAGTFSITGVGPALRLEGTPGASSDNFPIVIDASMTDVEVSAVIREQLAIAYANGDTSIIKNYREVNRLILHRLTDQDGGPWSGPPLGHIARMPGDDSGDFNSNLRGQQNDFRGVYLDDIIIGFAERGEQVFAGNTNASFLTFPPSTDIDVGQYQLEIRRAAPAAGRSFDTNDRLAKEFTFNLPKADQLYDGQTFQVSDGVNTVVFEWEDAELPAGHPNKGVGEGNIEILFHSRDADFNTTALNTPWHDFQVSAAVRDAINNSDSQNVLDLTAAVSDGVVVGLTSTSGNVNLFGNPAGDTAGSFDFGEIASTSYGVNLFGVPELGLIEHGYLGDQNLFRDQGHILIHSNIVRNAAEFGVLADAGRRDRGDRDNNNTVPRAGDLPHAGPVRHLRIINDENLVPGITIANNLLFRNASGGIQFNGDSNPGSQQIAPVSFGHIVNNTISGSISNPQGIGIDVGVNASPTLLNNIVANSATGVRVDPTSGSTILGGMLFHNNTSADTTGVGLGDFAIQLSLNDPLFVDAINDNYYLASGSLAIDSAVDALEDRFDHVTVKAPLGITPSPIKAPSRDVFGQLRADDPNASTPSGLGGNVFKDRGAIDRVDFTGPRAQVITPRDNDSDGRDLNPTFHNVEVRGGDSIVSNFELKLIDGDPPADTDEGVGINDTSVASEKVVVTRDGKRLLDKTDYIYSYNSTSDVIRLTPIAGIWEEGSYVIQLNNRNRYVVTPTTSRSVQDGDQFTITDDTGGKVFFEWESGFTVAVPRTLTLQVPLQAGGPGGIADAETFTIDDGTQVVTFEFDSNDDLSDSDHVQIVFDPSDSINVIATAIADAIAGAGVGLSPKTLGNGAVHVGGTPDHLVDLSDSSLGVTGATGAVADGDSFSYTPAGLPPVTFEFDFDPLGSVSTGNIPIPVRLQDTTEDIAESLARVVRSRTGLALNAQHIGSGSVHLGGQPGDTLDVSTNSSLLPTGAPGVTSDLRLQVPVAGGAPAGITDGQVFIVTNDITSVTFEFDDDNRTTSGNRIISINQNGTTSTQEEIANAIVGALASVSDLNLSPTDLGDGLVELGGTIRHSVDVVPSQLTASGVPGSAIPVQFVPNLFTAQQMVLSIISSVNEPTTPLTGVKATPRDGLTLFIEGVSGPTVAPGEISGIQNTFQTGIQDLATNDLQPNQTNGETRFIILVGDNRLDFGDLPDSPVSGGITNPYQTTFADNGPRHVIFKENPLFLGRRVDSDDDGRPSDLADGDDNAENVVVTADVSASAALTATMVDSSTPTTSLPLNIHVPETLFLQMPDLGGAVIMDGEFFEISNGSLTEKFEFDIGDGLNDSSATAIQFRAGSTDNNLAVAITDALLTAGLDLQPVNLGEGRIHLGSSVGHALDTSGAPSLMSGGAASTVVEGDSFSIDTGTSVVVFEFDEDEDVTPGNIPIDIGPQLTHNQLAQAIVDAILSVDVGVAPVHLGDGVVNLDGDDEDGVEFLGAFNASLDTPIVVTASAPGLLDAFIDFNQDGDFTDPGEKIFNGQPLVAGSNAFTVRVPDATSVDFETGARFRFSLEGGLGPNGLAASGEVEDYVITIRKGAPPVANPDPAMPGDSNFSTDEDTPIVGTANLLTNDTDDDGDSLEIHNPRTIQSDQGAEVVLNGDGTFSYDPTVSTTLQSLNEGDVIQDTFTYRANDGFLFSNLATVTITVTGVNDSPLAADLAFSAFEDGPALQRNFAATDVDAAATLSYEIIDDLPPDSGIVINNGDGTFVYSTRPNVDFQQLAVGEQMTVEFTYQAKDEFDEPSNVGTVTISVIGVNDNPVVQDVVISAIQGGPIVTGQFDGDDVDNDHLPGSLSYQFQPFDPPFLTEGSLVNNDDGSSFSFDPGQDFVDLGVGDTRVINVQYDATDVHGATSNLGNVSVVVQGINDPPVAVDDPPSGVAYRTSEDSSLVVTSTTEGVLANDSDPDTNDLLTIQGTQSGPITITSTNGATVTVNADGTFIYDPTEAPDLQQLILGQSLLDTFTYTVDDGNGGEASATATVEVTGRNSIPIANDLLITAQEDGFAVTDVLPGDDPDSDDTRTSLIYSLVGAPPNEGSVVLTNNPVNGGFTFDPLDDFQDLRPGETRDITFQYRVRDSHNAGSLPGTVTVRVTGTNDAPQAVDDVGALNEVNSSVTIDILANDIDIDGSPLDRNSVTLTQPSNGTISYDSNTGLVTYTSDTGFTGTDSFTYRVFDDEGADSLESNAATVTVVTTDFPVANDDTASTFSNTPVTIDVLANDSDPDGSLDESSVRIVDEPSNGDVQIQTDGTIIYTPPATFTGIDSFTYTVQDNFGAESNVATVTVDVGSNPTPLRNPQNRLDVFPDGVITPFDALLVISYLNTHGVGAPPPGFTPPPFVDTAPDDNIIDPRDVLAVVTELNRQAGLVEGGGEGEGDGAGEGEWAAPVTLVAPNFGGVDYYDSLRDSDEEHDFLALLQEDYDGPLPPNGSRDAVVDSALNGMSFVTKGMDDSELDDILAAFNEKLTKRERALSGDDWDPLW